MKRNSIILLSFICLVCAQCSKNSSGPSPAADFMLTAASTAIPAKVTLHNKSTLALSCSWDFGNGKTSIDENPAVIYTVPGTYEITLTATNTNGSTVARKTIVIEPAPTQCKIMSVKITNIPSSNDGSAWDLDGSTSDVYFRFLSAAGNIIYTAPTYYNNPQTLPLSWDLASPVSVSPLSTALEFELLDYDAGFLPDIMGDLAFAPSIAQTNLNDPYPAVWKLSYGDISIELAVQWK